MKYSVDNERKKVCATYLVTYLLTPFPNDLPTSILDQTAPVVASKFADAYPIPNGITPALPFSPKQTLLRENG